MMPAAMAKKGGKNQDTVSQSRMQALDDPTAAFPIGSLGQLVEDADGSDEDQPETQPDARSPVSGLQPGRAAEVDAPERDAPGTVRMGYLLLSLVGGGAAAALIGVVIVLVAVLLQQG